MADDQTADICADLMDCHACDGSGLANGHPLMQGGPAGACEDCLGEGKHPHPSKAVFEEMWRRKAQRREHFAYATVTHDVLVRETETRPGYTIPAGTRVLCTVVSRFGDIGIRDKQIDHVSHGYCSRVFPRSLRDVQLIDEAAYADE